MNDVYVLILYHIASYVLVLFWVTCEVMLLIDVYALYIFKYMISKANY